MWLAKIRSTNTGIWKYDWQRWEMQLEKWLAKMKNISAGKTGEREKQGFALSLKSEIFYNDGTSRFCEWLLQNRSIAAIVQQLSNKCVLRWPVFLYNSQHTRSHQLNTHQIPYSAFLSSCCVGWNKWHIKIQKYPLSLMLIQSALISMDKNMLITLPADVNAIAI